MLTKLTSQADTVRLVLTCDESVLEAQVVAARYLVDQELTDREGGGFVEDIVSVARAAAGTHSELVALFLELRSIGSVLLDKVLTGEERDQAVERLNEIMQDEDVRQALAYVRAQAALAQYRESSNVVDLLDPDPAGATWVEVSPVSREQLRKIERPAGPRPRLGALHHSHAADVARREGRRGNDGVEAFAGYIAKLDTEKQEAVEAFEDWQLRIDRGVFAASVVSVEGFDLEPSRSGYPVDEFVQQCPEANEVISEIARAAVQVGRLGKAGKLYCVSAPGTGESDDGAPDSQTAGRASSASAPTG